MREKTIPSERATELEKTTPKERYTTATYAAETVILGGIPTTRDEAIKHLLPLANGDQRLVSRWLQGEEMRKKSASVD